MVFYINGMESSIIDSMHNNTTQIEDSLIFNKLIYSHLSMHGIIQFTTKTSLYLHTITEKYILMFQLLIYKLEMYSNAIRTLSKGCLPTSLLTPLKLDDILKEVKTAMQRQSIISDCNKKALFVI